MAHTERLWPMKVAIRCLQVLSALLLITYAFTFYKFVDKSSIRYWYNDTKAEEGIVSEIPMKPLQRTIPVKDKIPEWLRTRITCDKRTYERRVYQKLKFWVVENFVKAGHGELDCREAVTLTIPIQGFPELGKLIPIIQRWRAPISLALYCSRDDYKNCLESIVYLKECHSVDSERYFLNKYLSIHIFFEDVKLPDKIFTGLNETDVNCYDNPMDRKVHPSTTNDLYRQNVARNIARDAALTYYILSSDIDLLPSVNLASDFLEMVALSGSLRPSKGTIYLLPVFEVKVKSKLPETSRALMEMLSDEMDGEDKQATCPMSSIVLNMTEWQQHSNKEEFSMYAVYPDIKDQIDWQPIFIGPRNSPYFDEQIGADEPHRRDKQGFRMCSNNLHFAVLTNAFLVHRSGVYQPTSKHAASPVPAGHTGIQKLTNFLHSFDFQCNLFNKPEK